MRKIVVVFFSLLREKKCLISCYCYGYFNRFFVFFCSLLFDWYSMESNDLYYSLFYSFWNLPQLNEGLLFFVIWLYLKRYVTFCTIFLLFFFSFFLVSTKKLELIHFLQGWFKNISFTCIFSLLFFIKPKPFFIYKVYLHKKSDCVLFAKKKNLLYKDNFFYVFFIVLGCFDQQIETCP